ncbi:MAG: AmmeMemoRadiSam system protein A, partial [Acidobacteriia bacterium]|nr:AmmeMemoRadiSam system protein A [Terriglobia bacterium]
MSPLSEADQRMLLGLARQALEACVRSGPLPEVAVPSGTLTEKGGAFVTLHKGSRLRGCIGYIEAVKPLNQTVMECAQAAALRDPRFDPVRPEELPFISLEISVLSPMEDLAPEKVEVG